MKSDLRNDKQNNGNSNIEAGNPEYNKMQSMFLKDEFCKNILKFIDWGYIQNPDKAIKQKLEYLNKSKKENKMQIRSINNFMSTKNDERTLITKISRKKFECGWWNVQFYTGLYLPNDLASEIDDKWIVVKLMSSIGDDYPAILKQMKSYANTINIQTFNPFIFKRVIIFNEFKGTNVSYEEVKEIFRLSDFYIIQLSEII